MRLQVIEHPLDSNELANVPHTPISLNSAQETSKQNSQLQESLAEVQQRLREQEALYTSRLAASENERRRCEQQVGAVAVERVGEI